MLTCVGRGAQALHETRSLAEIERASCMSCHPSLADLAAEQLAVENGRLIGRYSGRDIARFMAGHGLLRPDEMPIVVEALRRAAAP